MTRCSHATLTITEFGGWITEHSREDGEWTHNNEPGHYNSKLLVECHDCGHKAYYWRGAKRKPRWLSKAIGELGVGYGP